MTTEVRLPQWGMGMLEGTMVRWLKEEGEFVREGEALAEVESAKVNEELVAPVSGTLARIVAPAGTVVGVGEIVAMIAATEAASGLAAATESVAAIATPAMPVQASPLARRLAREYGVDLSQVKGTGPHGRITDGDVRGAAASRPAARVAAAAPSAGAEGTLIPLTGRRGAIARRMYDSLRSMAQLTLTTEADVSGLVMMRERLRVRFDLTYTDLLVKALALALRQHPIMNARIEGEEIRLLPEIHIGVAVAVENGLIVPVVRNADGKPLEAIARETLDLAQRARSGKVRPGEVTGSTFTVSNLGMYGVDAFTPIINPPEVAILGLGRIVERLARRDSDLVWRQMMTLSLTFDHRAADGAPAAAFLQTLSGLLEHPEPLSA